MSITTYNELLTAIGSWLQRDDITSLYPDFVTLFESDANAKLRTRLQQTVNTGTCTDAQIGLPSDFQSMNRVTWLGSSRRDLEYIEPEVMTFRYPTRAAGVPEAYTIEGQSMTILPADNATSIEFVYKQRIGPLASSTNWLFQKYPNLYLFGSLVEAQAYAVDPQKGAMWQQRRDEIYNDIMLLDFRSRANLSVQLQGATP